MPNRRRRTGGYINVRLNPNRDADLIAWWESLPSGTGGEVVKRAIRDYLRSAGEVERAVGVADLEQMARWIVEQVRGMALTPQAGGHAGSPLQDGERLTDQDVAARERKVKARKW